MSGQKDSGTGQNPVGLLRGAGLGTYIIRRQLYQAGVGVVLVVVVVVP